MKATKETFKEEIQYRLSSLETEMNEIKGIDELKYWLLSNEHSLYSEILELLKKFNNILGLDKIIADRYTPIKCYITKEPLKIGDKVKSSSSNGNGILFFDETFNQYVIRNEYNQNHRCSGFIKITDNFDYSIDNSKVECRSNPHKKKW